MVAWLCGIWACRMLEHYRDVKQSRDAHLTAARKQREAE